MKILALTFFLLLMMTEIFYAQTPPTIEPGVSEALARWRAANYSDVRYKLNITLEKGAPLMKGTIEVSVNVSVPPALAGGSTPAIILDWRKIRDKENLSNVSNVLVNGKPATLKPPADAGGTDLRYEERDEHLIFTEGVKAGENVIKLDFTSPIATSGAAITRYVDKTDGAEYVYSLFVPSDASTAFPVFDQPDLKARFQLSVNAPSSWKVITNTSLTDAKKTSYRKILANTVVGLANNPTVIEGLYLSEFSETKPISTYVFAFAAGEFAEFEDKTTVTTSREGGGAKVARRETSGKRGNDSRVEDAPRNESERIFNARYDADLSRRFTSGYFLDASSTQTSENLSIKIYVRKSQAEKFKAHAQEVFRLNREAVKNLESYFDYKFPFPKYDLVLIPEFPFGGMEHAGATFLREDRVIFPTEPTKNDYITRANVIFHEAAHQWFGDTVTMRWFDDLWLKEGFAEFMAYKTLEKVLPEYNAWKVFYERNKQAAYLTDVTRGTTPIYQEIPNLASAKSAYGNIVYRKAPSFLKQAEFLFGEEKFQIAVRSFLKKHQFANAEWTDLVKEFQAVSGYDLVYWGNDWVNKRGVPIIRINGNTISQENSIGEKAGWSQKFQIYTFEKNPNPEYKDIVKIESVLLDKFSQPIKLSPKATFIFPNYQDYGYGIFLLDEKSRAYVLENIQNEKDDFLRSMMWGSLWDAVRFYELAPEEYVRLVIKNINVEQDESTIQFLLGRVGTAMSYYMSEPSALADGSSRTKSSTSRKKNPPADAGGTDLAARLEKVLEERIANASTPGQRITFYRAYLNLASSAQAQKNLKDILAGKSKLAVFQLRTKDKFDIVTRLFILGDKDAPALLANLEKTETSDDAKRYAYAARAGIGTADNKAKYFKDFLTNKDLSESWIESAFAVWNTPRHAELTLPYLETALAELPNLKKNRKIFFVNGWLGAFIGGQKSEQALATVNKFLTDNQNLDRDLRLKILENADNLERAVKIRKQYGK